MGKKVDFHHYLCRQLNGGGMEIKMKLLYLDCCVRGEKESRTATLCRCFLEELKERNQELKVQRLYVYEERIEPLDLAQLDRRNELIQKREFEDPMFQYAHDFAEADYILVGAPYWDLSFPACLKNYIEQTSVNGIAFTYVETGSLGLCKAKKMMYISTAGGFVPGSHAGEEYMKQICDFYGVGKFEAYSVQGLDIEGADVNGMMAQAELEVKARARSWISEVKI